MSAPIFSSCVSSEQAVLSVVKRYWGYDSLRPLQAEAIASAMENRDSLVVLPTGGGKSLCYQVPPLLENKLHIVLSPLISLMKDQVDGLLACGYPAAGLHSGLRTAEKRSVYDFLNTGHCRLLFLSPERLLMPSALEMLQRLEAASFAVDEAHCISHWGHDFRPEYRKISAVRQLFPDAPIHAFTATATERVRGDVTRQLELRDPRVLIGSFDRPNLIYRALPRTDTKKQLWDVIARHRGEAVIVYAVSRKETETLAQFLQGRGVRAAAYHAGLAAGDRRTVQESFTHERLDVVVATVAFGMGIDRSNVRCVVHAGMPRSIEHYQQETGRAGRDGLEAECVLLFSPADILKWRSLIDRTAQESHTPPDVYKASVELMEEMRRFASPGRCRHRSLVEYFGQEYTKDNCEACDVCLGESSDYQDATELAQKILSCVARVGQRFGLTHVVDILLGAETDRIFSLGHETLSTYGLLKGESRKALINITYQLIDQKLLERTDGRYPVLYLNSHSKEVLRGDRQVLIVPPKAKKSSGPRTVSDSWAGVDRDLFERLKDLRSTLARQGGVPPYVIFSDASLREMARLRPTTPEDFLKVPGVGERKLATLGDFFLPVIRQACD